jgi:hypothetical protein
MPALATGDVCATDCCNRAEGGASTGSGGSGVVLWGKQSPTFQVVAPVWGQK